MRKGDTIMDFSSVYGLSAKNIYRLRICTAATRFEYISNALYMRRTSQRISTQCKIHEYSQATGCISVLTNQIAFLKNWY